MANAAATQPARYSRICPWGKGSGRLPGSRVVQGWRTRKEAWLGAVAAAVLMLPGAAFGQAAATLDEVVVQAPAASARPPSRPTQSAPQREAPERPARPASTPAPAAAPAPQPAPALSVVSTTPITGI